MEPTGWVTQIEPICTAHFIIGCVGRALIAEMRTLDTGVLMRSSEWLFVVGGSWVPTSAHRLKD